MSIIATVFHKASLTRNGITHSYISKDRSTSDCLTIYNLTFRHQEYPAFLDDLEEPVNKKILSKVNLMCRQNQTYKQSQTGQ